MATWYVAPKGTVSGANNGTGPADAWNGINACRAGMGSTSAGDTVVFRGDLGPYGFADQADFAYAGALTGAFAYVLGQSGPYIGSTSLAASNASGRIFQFATGAYGQAIVDMHRSDAAHTAAQRMYSSLFIQGEGMRILNPCVIAPNFNYLVGISGPSNQAESVSAENYGLYIRGNGNNVAGGTFVGYADTQGFCRAALKYVIEPSGSAGTATIIDDIEVYGAHFGVEMGVSGLSPYLGNGIIRNIRSGPASWGSTAATGFITGNAGTHGGHLSLSGNWQLLDAYQCTLDGICQDAVDLITANGTFRDSIIRNVYAPSVQAWTWTGAAWELTTVSGVTGNGIKMGLTGYTGTSPSTWDGSDGTPGGFYNVDEGNNRAFGNQISDVRIGIAANGGNGLHIEANEIYEAVSAGIYLDSAAARSNYWVQGNYAQLALASLANAKAILVGANANIILLNNILDCRAVGGANNVYDLHWLTALAPLQLNKNLYVNGTKLQTQPYPGTGDIAPMNPNWMRGAGLPPGSPLIGAGVHNGYRRDIRRIQRPNRPSIGAYDLPTQRRVLDSDPAGW